MWVFEVAGTSAMPVDMEVEPTIFVRFLCNDVLDWVPELRFQLRISFFSSDGTLRISKEELPCLETESLFIYRHFFL